jgi:hypothetical protein
MESSMSLMESLPGIMICLIDLHAFWSSTPAAVSSEVS